MKKAKNWKIGLIVVLMMLPVSVSNIHADFCDNEEVVFQQEQMIDETDEKITENNEFDTSTEIEEPQQTDAAVQNEKSDGENFICEENSPIVNGEDSSDMEKEEKEIFEDEAENRNEYLREKRSVIYVRDALPNEVTIQSNAEEYLREHDGSDYKKAVHSVEEAYELLDMSGGSGNIIICGRFCMQTSSQIPACYGMVYWSSLWGDMDYRKNEENPAYLYLYGKSDSYISLQSNLTLQNIDICYEKTNTTGIDANGYRLCIGNDIGTEVREEQIADVRISPAVDGKMGSAEPENFYVIGAGFCSRQVEDVHIGLYNTEIGGLIILYGDVTVGSETQSAVVEVIVRDTNIVQKEYSISRDLDGNLCSSKIYGRLTVSEELYTRNLEFVEVGGGTYTEITDSAVRNYVNKTENAKKLSFQKFHDFVMAEKKTILMMDGRDDRACGFLMNDGNILSDISDGSENTEIIILGGFTGSSQLWNPDTSVQNPDNSLRIQLGNKDRGSFVSLQNSSTETSGFKKDCYIRRSVRIDIYPGTRLGDGQDGVVYMDNTGSKEQKGRVCTTEEGYPVLAFHSGSSGQNEIYYLKELINFSIEADGCRVINEDERSTVSSIALKNGGSYEETFNETGILSLKRVQMDVNKTGGGNLYSSGDGNHFYGISGISTEGDCTIENGKLSLSGSNSFGSVTGIGNAAFCGAPGTTITTNKASAEETILLYCSQYENTMSDGMPAEQMDFLIRVIVKEENAEETLFTAGAAVAEKNITPLRVMRDGCETIWTMETEREKQVSLMQEAHIAPGRLFAGVTSNIPVNITRDSAFTAQFHTEYIPDDINMEGTKQFTKKLMLKSVDGKDAFYLPKGTTIVLLEQRKNAMPAYWYYYCTKRESEIELNGFKRMNTVQEENTETFGGMTEDTGKSDVTEDMIFVFDFARVEKADWPEDGQKLQGKVMLQYMDRTESCKPLIFEIASYNNGIQKFEIINQTSPAVYRQRERIKFELNIVPEEKIRNTKYEEREYAVLLCIRKIADLSEIAFPEGMSFFLDGVRMNPDLNGGSVIVPVRTEGKHRIEIESLLHAFEKGEYELTARLCTTSETGYFNGESENTDIKAVSNFTITDAAEYSLKVQPKSNPDTADQIVRKGETLLLTVSTDGALADEKIEVQLYRYYNGNYIKKAVDSVLTEVPIPAEKMYMWKPRVALTADAGTYRLEFIYHNRTEYWDFIVI